jgi:hypothetical protein
MYYAKIAAGAILTIGSVGLFIHRLPKREFQAVHEDKPRARPSDEAAQAAAAAKAAAKAAPAPAAPSAPAKPSVKPISLPTAQATALAAAAYTGPAEAVGQACSAEGGIFCNHVEEARLPKCLAPYADALLSGCRRALAAKGVKFDDER